MLTAVRSRSVHADEAANQRKRHDAEAQQQCKENQRAVFESMSGAVLEQVEQTIRKNVENYGCQREIDGGHFGCDGRASASDCGNPSRFSAHSGQRR